MAETLPLRRVVLYKNGVGYYTRRGAVGADSLGLPFLGGELDDVLKSLVMVTFGDTTVQRIEYLTADPRPVRVGDSSVRPEGDAVGLRVLLRELRRVPVELTLGDGDTMRGRAVGIERLEQGNCRVRTVNARTVAEQGIRQRAAEEFGRTQERYVQLETELAALRRAQQDLERRLQVTLEALR